MEMFAPLFQAVIAFCAVFTALGLLFSILLKPVKDGLKENKEDIKEARKSIAQIEQKFVGLEEGLKRIEKALQN